MRLGVDFADRIATVTALKNTETVLTIPAPSSARIFISRLEIFRFAAAALVAGVTPILITQTGLPGSMVWSTPAEVLAAGAATIQLWEPRLAMAAAAMNTAVVITAPATMDVIWRMEAHYVYSYYSKH